MSRTGIIIIIYIKKHTFYFVYIGKIFPSSEIKILKFFQKVGMDIGDDDKESDEIKD